MVVRPESGISHKTIEVVRYRQALSGNKEKISLCAEIAVGSNSLVGLWFVVLKVDSKLDPNDDISAVHLGSTDHRVLLAEFYHSNSDSQGRCGRDTVGFTCHSRNSQPTVQPQPWGSLMDFVVSSFISHSS